MSLHGARAVSLAFAITGVLLASRARAEPDAPDHPRLTLGTTGGATFSGGNGFFIGQLDLRTQLTHHARMVFALQASGPGNQCVDGVCPTPYYFATLASVQYDVTRATDSNIWFGAATGVPVLVAGSEASSGVLAEGELTIDIRISRCVSLEIGARAGIEWMSVSTYVEEGSHFVGDVRMGLSWDLIYTQPIAPKTTALR